MGIQATPKQLMAMAGYLIRAPIPNLDACPTLYTQDMAGIRARMTAKDINLTFQMAFLLLTQEAAQMQAKDLNKMSSTMYIAGLQGLTAHRKHL